MHALNLDAWWWWCQLTCSLVISKWFRSMPLGSSINLCMSSLYQLVYSELNLHTPYILFSHIHHLSFTATTLASRKAWNLWTEYCFGCWQWRTTTFCQTSCFLSDWWEGRKYNGSCASTGLTKQQSPARQTKRGLTWPANWLRLIVCWKLNKMSIYHAAIKGYSTDEVMLIQSKNFGRLVLRTCWASITQAVGLIKCNWIVLWIYSEAILHWGLCLMYFSIRRRMHAVRKG